MLKANATLTRKDIETAGYGIKKIYRLCKEEKVDINYINNESDFTFEFSRIDRNDYFDGEINGETNGEISKNEEKVLDVLRSNNKLTKQGLIELTELSSRTLDRIIADLKVKGILERQGSNKTGYWKVK